jgi:hypothetical protein
MLMIVFLRSSSVGDNTHTAPASPQATGVEEQCALAASEAKKLESGEAEKLRGWGRLDRSGAGAGWKAGASAHHSPFTVDMCNHSQLAQQGSTATIGCGHGILLAF